MPRIPTKTIWINGRKKIVSADDPRECDGSGGITREAVAAMDGPDLTDLLEAHGVEDVPHRLDDRREMVTRIMFMEV